jgi:carbonic anhydrase
MSCPDATAPIDISKENVAGKCDLKCELSFHYIDSSCIATNRGDYISLSYDSSSSPPVTYNSYSYDVKEVRIYSPSLHSFNGTKADGEFIIVHNSASGANPLLICIPIKSSNSGEVNSKNLANIISSVATKAPAENEQTTVNISRFNLNAFVPRKPFFSYTATEPYQPCSANQVEYIVFPAASAIGSAELVLSALRQIITENVYDIKPSPGLFFNKKGPTNGPGSGEIYIDCQPVGQSEEEEIIVTDSGNNSGDSLTGDSLTGGSITMENKYFQMIIIILIVIVLVYFVKLMASAFSPKDFAKQMPSVVTGG